MVEVINPDDVSLVSRDDETKEVTIEDGDLVMLLNEELPLIELPIIVDLVSSENVADVTYVVKMEGVFDEK